jgi:hypothetical protein
MRKYKLLRIKGWFVTKTSSQNGIAFPYYQAKLSVKIIGTVPGITFYPVLSSFLL